jgi:hypothetical protein
VAKEEWIICRLTSQAKVESEAVEAAFHHVLELSKNDGSIVLSASSMFVTGEVVMAWDKIGREAESEIVIDQVFKKRCPIPNHE